MIIDRTSWGRLRVTGGDRVRFLQGLTTVNVEALAEGVHGWGAILNPKGRVLSVIQIARAGDAFVIACEPSLAEPTRALLERYAVMDDVAFEPLTGAAYQVWDTAADVWAAPFVAGDGVSEGGPACAESAPEVEQLRIHGGFLRYGADVDADHFPFETPLANFLDYGKGCYVGQEPVFRVHAQGNAARALRGFEIAGIEPLATTAIAHASKPAAGDITSSIADPAHGITIALGYLHRTVSEAGGTVTIGGRAASVHELPW
jgi:folate-binding protein YgfZ